MKSSTIKTNIKLKETKKRSRSENSLSTVVSTNNSIGKFSLAQSVSTLENEQKDSEDPVNYLILNTDRQPRSLNRSVSKMPQTDVKNIKCRSSTVSNNKEDAPNHLKGILKLTEKTESKESAVVDKSTQTEAKASKGNKIKNIKTDIDLSPSKKTLSKPPSPEKDNGIMSSETNCHDVQPLKEHTRLISIVSKPILIVVVVVDIDVDFVKNMLGPKNPCPKKL